LITLEDVGVIGKKKLRAVDPVIFLEDDSYSAFLATHRQETSDNDILFNINNETFLRVNRAKIALSSSYFYNLLSGSYE
jgi:hypothetical protein